MTNAATITGQIARAEAALKNAYTRVQTIKAMNTLTRLWKAEKRIRALSIDNMIRSNNEENQRLYAYFTK